MTNSAQLLRTRRKLLGLSQRDVSRLTGVKQPLLSAIETGKRQATPAVSESLAQHLQVRPSEALDVLRSEVKQAIARHGGKSGSVFGSVATGNDTVESDLDLIVDFAPDCDITDLLALQDDLANLLTVPVDVVSAGSSSTFVQDVKQQAVPL